MKAMDYDGPFMEPLEIEDLWRDVVDDNLGLLRHLVWQVGSHTAVTKALTQRIAAKISDREEQNSDFLQLLADREMRRKRFMMLARKREKEVDDEEEREDGL